MRSLLLILMVLWLITAGLECRNRSALRDATGDAYERAVAEYDRNPVPGSRQAVQLSEAKRMMAMSRLNGISILPAGMAIAIGLISAFRRKMD